MELQRVPGPEPSAAEREPEPANNLGVFDVCSSSESELEPAHDRGPWGALDVCSSSDSEGEPAPVNMDICSSTL
jgi:hypothetical protein